MCGGRSGEVTAMSDAQYLWPNNARRREGGKAVHPASEHTHNIIIIKQRRLGLGWFLVSSIIFHAIILRIEGMVVKHF